MSEMSLVEWENLLCEIRRLEKVYGLLAVKQAVEYEERNGAR
jgi:hypothetical protein